MELRKRYPLKELLKLAKLPRSTYYYYISKVDTDKYSQVKQEIIDIFASSKQTYGYRRIHSVLRQKEYNYNHKTVYKLMKQLKLVVRARKAKYKSYKGEVGKTANNILNRNFTATSINTKWVTDVTEFAVCNEKVYLSPIMDLYNREIVAYDISTRPNFEQTKRMLHMATAKLQSGDKPVLHSDQGWQYQMKPYRRILKQHNITQSMSRKGNCLDNACIENFFGRLKVEMYYGITYTSVGELIQAIHNYIYYHNHTRISLKLKGMTPVQYRSHSNY